MDKDRLPVEVLPIGAIMVVPGVQAAKVAEEISEYFEADIVRSDEFSVQDFTHYYDREMGPEITKCLYYLKGLQPIEGAERWKLWSNRLESDYAEELSHSRPINIDPGYLTLSKLVLFSTKGYAHRIYLSNRIYAEVTLQFRHNTFHTLPWTYDDYQTDQALEFWEEAREVLRGLLAGNR